MSKYPPGSPGAIKEAEEDAAAQLIEDARLDAILDARRLDMTKPPAKPVPRFWLQGKVISTPGNIFAIQAGVKSRQIRFYGRAANQHNGTTR